jgi:beta-lactamase superfamily II metal-dependent hydrolase
MSIVHFLNVLQGDCNVIQHSNSNRVTLIDVCNADSDEIYENAELRNAIKDDVSDTTTGNYGQKKYPENPIKYLQRLNINTIWRFIVSHPDMDHIDGIRDLFSDINIFNVWDTSNNKEINDFSCYGRFNEYDWEYYKKLRARHQL